MKRKERTQKATHRFFRHEHHLLGYSAPDGAFDGFDFSIILWYIEARVARCVFGRIALARCLPDPSMVSQGGRLKMKASVVDEQNSFPSWSNGSNFYLTPCCRAFCPRLQYTRVSITCHVLEYSKLVSHISQRDIRHESGEKRSKDYSHDEGTEDISIFTNSYQ